MLKFPCPSVAPGPKWTAWTLLTLSIIFSFLVGTADDPIGKNNGLGAMAANEGQHFLHGCLVEPNILGRAVPALQRYRFLFFGRYYADSDLRRHLVGRPIKRNCCCRVAGKTTLRPLAQGFDVAFS